MYHYETKVLLSSQGKEKLWFVFLGRYKICIQTGLSLAIDEINHAFSTVIIKKNKKNKKNPGTIQEMLFLHLVRYVIALKNAAVNISY